MSTRDDSYEGGESPANKVIYIAMVPYNLQYLRGKDLENCMDFGRDMYRRGLEDAGPLGGIRLPEPAGVRWRFSSIDGDPAIRASSKNYRSVVYFERCSRVDEFGNPHRGGVWWGDECRKDQSGVEWTRYFADLVTDDYGSLVSSETGEAA